MIPSRKWLGVDCRRSGGPSPSLDYITIPLFRTWPLLGINLSSVLDMRIWIASGFAQWRSRFEGVTYIVGVVLLSKIRSASTSSGLGSSDFFWFDYQFLILERRAKKELQKDRWSSPWHAWQPTSSQPHCIQTPSSLSYHVFMNQCPYYATKDMSDYGETASVNEKDEPEAPWEQYDNSWHLCTLNHLKCEVCLWLQ